jgi:hypothetical protein
MINNTVTPNSRLILSEKSLYSSQLNRNENIDRYNSLDNESLDMANTFNEDNENYILGYN